MLLSSYAIRCNVIYTSILHGYDFKLSGPRDVIGHVTIGPTKCDFLYEVNCNHTSTLHGYRDIKLQIYWGHDLGVLG